MDTKKSYKQTDARHTPDYLFEASWEVCNKVGGIYTVLSTRANILRKIYSDHVFYIGPDVWQQEECPWFTEDYSLFAPWCNSALRNLHLPIRTGRWNVPGEPIVFLVNFEALLEQRDDIYTQMWTDYGVDSLAAYGDYHEATMFAHAAGLVIESFYRFHHLEAENVTAHFNEWMTGAGLLYIQKHVPRIATLFTTHATCTGRSIAGNNLPLYDHLHEYDGDHMAHRLNMTAKHSIEKKAAQHADCFTTVSDITAAECTQLLQRQPDVITPNGFEKNFVPKGAIYNRIRKKARKALLNVAQKTIGHTIPSNALLIATSGRYEYRNKGIDLFIDALSQLREMPQQLEKNVVAFIMVPGWTNGARNDLLARLSEDQPADSPLQSPFVTHQLAEPQHDMVMNQISRLKFSNSPAEKVKILFVPCYLNGDDGIFNLSYYDLLPGFDLTVFPSYYEPWGYTPHESIAFSVPTITTTLAGFGVWAGKEETTGGAVQVIDRNDENSAEVAEKIAAHICSLSQKNSEQITELRQSAVALASTTDWAHFILHYQEAYGKALHNSYIRLSHPCKLKAE
jgi:glycosyltransferase involved in cell wall biosynthesis